MAANRHHNTWKMPDSAIPFFPFKFRQEKDRWIVRNPITCNEHELNESAYILLQLCDGFRSLAEITHELSHIFQVSDKDALELSIPVFKVLSGEGLLWWRNSRIHSWKLPPPMAVLWDLTSKCNLSCRHCVVSAGSPNPGELDIDICRRLIDEMAGFGVQQLILSGGEPLLRPDFFDIAEYAHKSGLSLQIATNATMVTRDVARRLKAIGASVQASLDSMYPVVHDELRQCKGSWNRAVKGIKLLVKNDVPVTIAALVTKNTIAQIPELYDFSAELGVQTFRILPFVPSGRGEQGKRYGGISRGDEEHYGISGQEA